MLVYFRYYQSDIAGVSISVCAQRCFISLMLVRLCELIRGWKQVLSGNNCVESNLSVNSCMIIQTASGTNTRTGPWNEVCQGGGKNKLSQKQVDLGFFSLSFFCYACETFQELYCFLFLRRLNSIFFHNMSEARSVRAKTFILIITNIHLQVLLFFGAWGFGACFCQISQSP